MAKDEELKAREQDIFHKWRQTQQPRYFQELYMSMKPLLYEAAKKASFGSNVPETAHRAWAAQNFMDALRTFDPTKGRALASHVYDTVHQKAKRLNYMYQNLGHIPEPRIQALGTFQNEHQFLKEKLGREPSAAELADQLGWSVNDVSTLRKEVRKDLAMGEGTEEVPYFESNRDEEILNFLYYDLAPQEQVMYEYVFGKHGKPAMVKPNMKPDYDKIAAAMGVSSSKARTIFGSIQDKLHKALKR